jgi:predicted ATPase
VPFVGREVELAALRAALDLTRGGRGQVAVLSGEAGIGKTSTIRAFGETAKAELSACCSDND